MSAVGANETLGEATGAEHLALLLPTILEQTRICNPCGNMLFVIA